MNQLDKDIFNLREEKKTLEALERLLGNRDFQRVIMDDYMTKEPLRLLKGKGVLKLDPQTNQDIDRQLDTVALFSMDLDNRISELRSIDYRIQEAETLRDEQTKGY